MNHAGKGSSAACTRTRSSSVHTVIFCRQSWAGKSSLNLLVSEIWEIWSTFFSSGSSFTFPLDLSHQLVETHLPFCLPTRDWFPKVANSICGSSVVHLTQRKIAWRCFLIRKLITCKLISLKVPEINWNGFLRVDHNILFLFKFCKLVLLRENWSTFSSSGSSAPKVLFFSSLRRNNSIASRFFPHKTLLRGPNLWYRNWSPICGLVTLRNLTAHRCRSARTSETFNYSMAHFKPGCWSWP